MERPQEWWSGMKRGKRASINEEPVAYLRTSISQEMDVIPKEMESHWRML